MRINQDLPDELQGDGPAEPVADAEQQLQDLSLAIAEKRDAAVKARRDSGIEDVWAAAEQAYLCMDDSNRASFANAKWAKPTSLNAGLTAEGGGKRDATKSTAFVRLTPRYVDAGYAKICEIILPVDDKPFSFGPTPDPELVKNQKDKTPVVDEATGQPIMRAAGPNDAQALGQPTGDPVPPGLGAPPPQVPLTAADMADHLMQLATAAAEKAQTRVYDWMVECKYPAEMRKVIFDAARIGAGVLKGPFPTMHREQALTTVNGQRLLQSVDKVVPAVKWIDPWNFFPDGACGEDIYDGDYCFERDFLTEGKLKALKRQKDQSGKCIYLSAQIDKVLAEGPGKCKLGDGENPAVRHGDGRYEVWYMTGTLTRQDMQAAAAVGLEDLPDELQDVFAIVTMVNDSVIRVTINPLDSGKFGYHAMPWSRRAGHWAGVGIAEQVTLPQAMVNAGTRSLLNNGGLSSGIQIIMDQMMIVPADTDWKITPNKIWYKADGANMDDVRKAFMSVEFPNVGNAMMTIIQYGFKLAEEACNIPLVAQGQVNADTPDTFGAVELHNSNANTLLRSIAYAVDDHITERVVHEFYEYLLLDPNVPDDEKGDFNINARGSIAMVEKAIQERTMLQAGQMTQNPAYGIDPKKWFAEYWKTKRLDPRKIQFSAEDLAKMQSQAPPPPLPLQLEQLKGQNALQLLQAKGQQDLQATQQEMQHEQQMLQTGGATPQASAAMARIASTRIKAESDQAIQASRSQAETAYAAAQAQIARDNAAARHQEILDKRELAILEYSLKNNQTLTQVKADLAKTAMQEQTKRQLAQADIALSQSEGRNERAHDMNKHLVALENDAALRQADQQVAQHPSMEAGL